MKSASLEELYVDELEGLYNAKRQMGTVLPQMLSAAHAPDLRAALELYLGQTRGQINRLRRVFRSIGARPRVRKCRVVDFLLADGRGLLRYGALPEDVDAALLAAARRAVDEEMTGYGCVRTYARLLYFDDAALLLQESLDEEGAVEQQLRLLAGNKSRNRMRTLAVTV